MAPFFFEWWPNMIVTGSHGCRRRARSCMGWSLASFPSSPWPFSRPSFLSSSASLQSSETSGQTDENISSILFRRLSLFVFETVLTRLDYRWRGSSWFVGFKLSLTSLRTDLCHRDGYVAWITLNLVEHVRRGRQMRTITVLTLTSCYLAFTHASTSAGFAWRARARWTCMCSSGTSDSG